MQITVFFCSYIVLKRLLGEKGAKKFFTEKQSFTVLEATKAY